MTNQEAYERVVRHLLEQGEVSETDRGCAYRGDYGLKCAVGCLIPDEEYEVEFEGKSVLAYELCAVPSLEGLDFSLLRALQGCHDELDPGQWPGKLRGIGEKFKLTIPEELL